MNNVWSVKERRHASTGAYIVGSDNAGDFVDAFIDVLREYAPSTDCYDADTIRAVLGAMLEGDE